MPLIRAADPITKRFLRQAYSAVCGAQAACNLLVPRRGNLAVYYGGARSGDQGGPLVKVARLREHFPEERWGYDLVYLLSNAAYLPDFALRLLKQRRIPIVHNQNGVFYAAWYAGDWEAQNRRMARSYRAADWVFFQSEFCRRAADRFLGSRSGPGEILYNAVDTSRFFPGQARQAASQGEYVFLLTGVIDAHLYYRLESTIAGLRLACDGGLNARLTVAGRVDAESRMRADALAENLGIAGRIRFTGPYSQRQAPDVYRSADAYVMTKHNDPCPNTVLEALATGLPVLYSDSGGVPELVGADAGIALPCAEDWDTPHTPATESIGAGMLQIAANHAAFSAVARHRAVERFDITHWIGRHRAVFEQLAGKH